MFQTFRRILKIFGIPKTHEFISQSRQCDVTIITKFPHTLKKPTFLTHELWIHVTTFHYGFIMRSYTVSKQNIIRKLYCVDCQIRLMLIFLRFFSHQSNWNACTKSQVYSSLLKSKRLLDLSECFLAKRVLLLVNISLRKLKSIPLACILYLTSLLDIFNMNWLRFLYCLGYDYCWLQKYLLTNLHQHLQ